MISQNRKVSSQNSHPNFDLDQKKLVKAFLYNHFNEWIEYFTGFLLMDFDGQVQKIRIKIRFSRHPHLNELQPPEAHPLDILTDQQGLYTQINQQNIKTIEKPEQKLLYLKIGVQGKIIALSFQSKAYCNTILEHFSLVLESKNQNDNSWTKTTLPFLNASMKQNLVYVDLTFTSQDRVDDFLHHFDRIDQALYANPEKTQHQDSNYMTQFFYTLKYVFTRANEKVIRYFIDENHNFQIVLKCLSCNSQLTYPDNPFGKYQFDYLKEFKKMTVVHSTLLNLEDSEFNLKYQLITKIKFLKDVALCTFIDMTTEAKFSEIISRAHISILESLGNPKNQIIQKMKELGNKDEEKFINVFCQIWQIFKAILEDFQTMAIKEAFYLRWIQNAMFSETLSVIGRIMNHKEIANFHPRFWQKLLQALNPMLSYEWADSQKMVLLHQLNANKENTLDLMTSLIMLLAHSDSNTKVLVLDFVRVQIEVSENRKQISAKYLSYIFKSFFKNSFEYCMNENDIEKYIEFIMKIYIAQPIRTRHFIIESKLMTSLKPYMENKFVFIMALKLLKTFVEVGQDDTFTYLLSIDTYDCLRSRYAQNKRLKNIINSLFLAIFKSAVRIKSSVGKRYLERIFFSEEGEIVLEQNKEVEKDKSYKRQSSVSLAQMMEVENRIKGENKRISEQKVEVSMGLYGRFGDELLFY